MSVEVVQQRAYYTETAERYDAMHVDPMDEHGLALGAFMGMADALGGAKSVLDVGAGTGRGLQAMRARWPAAALIGVEPVAALRAVGHRAGLPAEMLVDGNALALPFDDGSFDYVIETGVLHHVARPLEAVAEMVRVARRGVLISDSNNVGQGSASVRLFKAAVKTLGLWPAMTWLQTGGRMYKTSDTDGVFYSFSAFDCVPAMRAKFPFVAMMNTTPAAGFDLRRGASHVMLFAHRGAAVG